jgi:hypothetical protein
MLSWSMKRATITFSSDLEAKLSAYMSKQKTPPSLNTVVQTALEEFLEAQKWAAVELQPAKGQLDLPTSDAEVEPDVSLNHDAYVDFPHTR